jgi:hypothetical protein
MFYINFSYISFLFLILMFSKKKIRGWQISTLFPLLAVMIFEQYKLCNVLQNPVISFLSCPRHFVLGVRHRNAGRLHTTCTQRINTCCIPGKHEVRTSL